MSSITEAVATTEDIELTSTSGGGDVQVQRHDEEAITKEDSEYTVSTV